LPAARQPGDSDGQQRQYVDDQEDDRQGSVAPGDERDQAEPLEKKKNKK